MKTHRNRVRFAAAAAALLCTGVMPAGAFVPVESSVFGSDSYAAYASAGHTGKSPASPLSLDMREPAVSEKAETLEELNGYSGPSLKLAEGGFAEWSFNFPEDTLCHVEISCCQVTGRGANAEFALYINGEIPFSSAAGFEVRRIYKDDVEGGAFQQDSQGNDIIPSVREYPVWQDIRLTDPRGYEQEPYLFRFPAGKNTLRIALNREGLAIRSIRLSAADEIPAYAEVQREYERLGYRPASDYCQTVQGELPLYKNSKSILPKADRSSPTTTPGGGAGNSLNYIGADNWKSPGASITWEIEVKQDGLYKILIKSRQKYSRDVNATRQLLIDGQLPFQEAAALAFPYSSDWQNYTVGGEEDPFLFYLTAGRHTVTLSVSLGEIGEVIGEVDASLTELNRCYRDILMAVGTSPDAYRDYNLDKLLPETIAAMGEQADRLRQASARMVKLTGSRGSNTAVLDRIVTQLTDMSERPDTIAKRFSVFKDSLGSLGTWLLTASEQALDIDFLQIASPDFIPARADGTFVQKLWHETKAFLRSFTADYSIVSNSNEAQTDIEVWLATGRDQVQVLKKLIESDFTPHQKVNVNLKLVQASVLLPSTATGRNPDVYLQAASGDAVNYAMRGALVDLSAFSDYQEVEKRFHPSAITPLKYRDGVYALPETQSYTMLFYRKDILSELGIGVPETWDEIHKILPILQKNNMNFAMPVSTVAAPDAGMSTFYMFLLQRGGSLYNDALNATRLDGEESIAAFKQWTSFYVDYTLPQTYDAANRFRLGETPLLLADYSLYNTLQVFAPEIASLWGIEKIPGTAGSSGTVSRANSGSGVCSMILAKNDDVEASWKFLRWWTSAEVQSAYGTEIENVLGASARYPTANLEAVRELPWSATDYQKLVEQREELIGIPQVPGSYFISRHLTNAFRSVVISGAEPRESLVEYTETINREIADKIDEFS